ncbi:MAG: PaaI family thioesterase [Dehalococcoidia bacterium]
MAREQRPPMGFQALMGLDIYERGEGYSRARVQLTADHMNPHGVCHGGVLYTMADTSMGGALYSKLAEDESCATIEIKMVYMATAREGSLVECETRLVNKGRRVAVLESDVRVGERLIAKALGTFAIFEA